MLTKNKVSDDFRNHIQSDDHQKKASRAWEDHKEKIQEIFPQKAA